MSVPTQRDIARALIRAYSKENKISFNEAKHILVARRPNYPTSERVTREPYVEDIRRDSRITKVVR